MGNAQPLKRQNSVSLYDGLAKIKVPFATSKGIWEKVEALLSEKENALAHAPGFGPKHMMVKSRSGSSPHLVTTAACGTGIQYKCDDKCTQYKSIGMCSHIIAASEYNCALSEFLRWYCTNCRTKPPNSLDLGQFGMPQGAGRKGEKAPSLTTKPLLLMRTEVSLDVTSEPVSTPKVSPPVVPQAFLAHLLVLLIRICIGLHHETGEIRPKEW